MLTDNLTNQNQPTQMHNCFRQTHQGLSQSMPSLLKVNEIQYLMRINFYFSILAKSAFLIDGKFSTELICQTVIDLNGLIHRFEMTSNSTL